MNSYWRPNSFLVLCQSVGTLPIVFTQGWVVQTSIPSSSATAGPGRARCSLLSSEPVFQHCWHWPPLLHATCSHTISPLQSSAHLITRTKGRSGFQIKVVRGSGSTISTLQLAWCKSVTHSSQACTSMPAHMFKQTQQHHRKTLQFQKWGRSSWSRLSSCSPWEFKTAAQDLGLPQGLQAIIPSLALQTKAVPCPGGTPRTKYGLYTPKSMESTLIQDEKAYIFLNSWRIWLLSLMDQQILKVQHHQSAWESVILPSCKTVHEAAAASFFFF